MLLTSWLVLKPSKKCKNGKLDLIADKWATAARFWASSTFDEASIAKPVGLAAYISLWSPKIDKALVAIVLAATWITPGNISPAILYILGSINNKPWLAV